MIDMTELKEIDFDKCLEYSDNVIAYFQSKDISPREALHIFHNIVLVVLENTMLIEDEDKLVFQSNFVDKDGVKMHIKTSAGIRKNDEHQ